MKHVRWSAVDDRVQGQCGMASGRASVQAGCAAGGSLYSHLSLHAMFCVLCLLRVCRFVVCSKQQGAVARFINHSCDPSLYVQPMCMGHTNTEMVSIGLFAAKTIPPFTELR